MRKRFIGLLLLVLLALSGLSMPALAATPEALTALASYFPADTVVFAALRTDDGYIEELDALLQRVGHVIPDAVPPVSLPFLLNVASMDSLGVSFQEGFRSWLGDTAAFGVLSLEELMFDEAPGVLLAIEITDRTAALEYIERSLEGASGFEKSREHDYQIFNSEQQSVAIAVNDDVLLISTSIDDLALDGDFSRLSADDGFVTSLTNLPAPDYNILLYMNTPELQASNLNMMRQRGVESPLLEMSANAIGASVIGFTLLDERSLTIDVVSQINLLDSMVPPGMEPFVPAPVDPAFAERVPADAPFVLLGSDLGQSLTLSFDSLRRLDALVAENGGWEGLFGPDIDAQTRAAIQGFSFGGVLGAVNVTFAGLTGLSLENDVLPMFDGNFALFLRAAEDEALALIPDFGFVSEVGDSELAFANLAQLRASLEAYGSPYNVESLGDEGEVIAVQWLRSLLQTSSPNVDILFGTDGFSFAAGTRHAVLDARDSLSNDPSYLAAQRYFLSGSTQIGYVGGRALVRLVEQLIASGLVSPDGVSDLAELRSVLMGIESASITGAYLDGDETATTSAYRPDQIAAARFVLTLADMPVAAAAPSSQDAPQMTSEPPPGAEIQPTQAVPSGTGDLPPGIVTPTSSP
jgi:hypothetical protein